MKINRKLLVQGKRFLALLLAVTMVTGTLPSSIAYAAEIPAADTEDVVNVLPDDDVTVGDIAAENVGAADAADSAIGGAEVYAVGDPEPIKYTFDRTAFDEEYKTALPYGDADIQSWNYWVRSTVHVLADGINRGTLEYVDNNGIIVWESQWQMQGEEGWTDVSAPNNRSKVGNYKLNILIPAVEGVSDKADYEMTFEITKAEVEPKVTIDPVTPGTLAQ
ncbi:MAG: hypothetical protein K2O57_11310, partial [Acetatifactor sp.]|nr:hypothetical protein [Acetatifactor sp.]